ncbi:ParB/RepB/Spo0J family partition protein [Desulfatitalea tepidiphila]|uniref:ParB/RepB/Spo0J family partition protein n=1 Tax=Desulfatitalea tepidiphila TaxID=1185843 RepID=UPI0006B45D4A|nr:ParB/RepB/Spo0J family partition protein [Desulfatitalea tepidiphila]
MGFECRCIELAQIDRADSTFRISTDSLTDRLKASIRQIGLLHPPLLLSKTDASPVLASNTPRFVIVSGFARVEACQELGWDVIQAHCLPPDAPVHRCTVMAIADNLHRPLNVVEMARAAALVERTDAGRTETFDLLASIGFKLNDDLVGKLNRVGCMNERLQRGLIEGTIALPTAIELHEMGDNDGAQALAEFFLKMQLSLSRQREVLEWVQAIVHRERTDISQLLTDVLAGHRMDDIECDRPKVSNQIRQFLRRRRYPAISAYEQRYAQSIKALKVPNGIQLHPSPHFEHPSYSLHINFTTLDDLKERLKSAHRLAESNTMASLLEPIIKQD